MERILRHLGPRLEGCGRFDRERHATLLRAAVNANWIQLLLDSGIFGR
jgi:hypothetical protein